MEINVSNVSVRRVGDPDIEEMVTHRLAYLIEMQGNRDESYLKNLKKELKDYFQRNIHSGNFIALIAETEGQILGYGGYGNQAYTWRPEQIIVSGRGYIKHVYVTTCTENGSRCADP
jgi:hypothetical protein